jgi:hypothetical protein
MSQSGPDESHYDTQVDGMHAITHERLVHTEVCNKPKRIEPRCAPRRDRVSSLCEELGPGR